MAEQKRVLLGFSAGHDSVKKGEREWSCFSKGEEVYLTKHEWACSWYWGFGYIGNKNVHTHFDSEFLGQETAVKNLFEKTRISQKTWWILRDLFVQAYALQKCAEVYRYGGHQITDDSVAILRNENKAQTLNADLEIVLNLIWKIVNKKGKKI